MSYARKYLVGFIVLAILQFNPYCSVVLSDVKAEDMMSVAGWQKMIVPIPELSKKPKIDGDIDSFIAKESFQPNSMFLLDSTIPAANATDVFIAKKGSLLYVAAKCFYEEGKSVTANTEKRDGPVYNEDCVEIFMQNNKDIYHWIVNPKGVLFDEINRESAWNGQELIRTSIKDDHWIAEFLIDLAVLKVGKLEDIKFNIARNDKTKIPAQISSLALVKGYSLHASQYFITPVSAKSDKSFSTNYTFIAGGPGIHGYNSSLNAELSEGTKVWSVVYDSDGRILDRQSSSVGNEQPSFDHYLSITDPVVHQFIIEYDNKVYANILGPVRVQPELNLKSNKEISKAEFPWLGSKLGIDNTVPLPYEPIGYTKNTISIVGREYLVGEAGIFEQLVANGHKLLTNKSGLYVEVNGKVYDGVWSEAVVEVRQPDKLVLTREIVWNDIVKGQLKMTVEFDGFVWCDLKITTDNEIDALYYEATMNKSYFKYLSSSEPANRSKNEQIKILESGAEFDLPFMEGIWCGDEDLGLGFCTDSDEDYVASDQNKVYQVACKKDSCLFRLNFVSKSSKKLNSNFQWGIQATPSKPVRRSVDGEMAWVNIHYPNELKRKLNDYPGQSENFIQWLADGGTKNIVLFNYWAKYQGGDIAVDPQDIKWIVNEAHSRGIKVLLYRSCEMADVDPKWTAFAETSLAQPTSYGYRREQPVKQVSYIYCSNSIMQDYFIWSCDWLMNEYDVDGFYLDGVVHSGGCLASEHGCGYVDEEGKKHLTYTNMSNRGLLKRLYRVVKKHKPDGLIDAHTGGYSASLSFATSLYYGEQYYIIRHYDKDPLEILPLDVFRSCFLSYAKGVSANLLIYDGCPFLPDEANSIAFIHGISPRPHALESIAGRLNFRKTSKIWRALNEFGADDAEWIPYWSKDFDLKVSYTYQWIAQQGKAKVSYYKNENGDYLYLLSNFAVVPTGINIVNDKLSDKKYYAEDMLTGEAVNVEGNKVWTSLEPYKLKMIRVSAKKKAF